MKRFLIITLCLSLLGCASMSNKQQKPFVEPQLGQTRQQLMDMIGKPQTIEIYQRPDKTRIAFYIYVRKYQSSQEKVPVCLIDNKVVGWGRAFYEDHVSMEDIRIK